MVTSAQALKKYGDPSLASTQQKHFVLWLVPADIQEAFKHVRFTALGTIGFPNKIFLNKDLQGPLEEGLRNVMLRGLAGEMKTWDGVFVLRNKRGLQSMSLHSFAIAFDVNQEENQLNMEPKLSPSFVKCFTDALFDWGGTWKRKDGMHFQLATI